MVLLAALSFQTCSMLFLPAGWQAARSGEKLLLYSSIRTQALTACGFLRSVASATLSAQAPPALDVTDAPRQQLQQQQQQQQLYCCSMQQSKSQLQYLVKLQHQLPCWPSQQCRLQALPLPAPQPGSSNTTRAYSSIVAALRTSLGSSGPMALHLAASAASEQQVGHVLTKHPHQLQQQQGMKQLRSYDEAPRPLPRYRKPSKDGRMNRMVIRVPPQVQLELKGQQLVVTGKAGSTSLSLPFLDPTGLVAWQCHTQSTAAAAAGPGTGSLLLLASPSRRCWRGIQTHINNAVHGVMQGYLVGVTVQGVGYRLEPVADTAIAAALAARKGSAGDADTSSSSKQRILWEQEAEKTNIAYPHKQPAKAVRLKVGYTRACIFQLPEGVLAFFVKPTLMYLYGIDKALVTNTAAAMRAIRKPNAYTGNGIQLVGETLKLKQRAGSK